MAIKVACLCVCVCVCARYKIVSERRAVNSAELSETSLDEETDVQSLASYLCVYDVEKLADDVDPMLTSVSNNVRLVLLALHF